MQSLESSLTTVATDVIRIAYPNQHRRSLTVSNVSGNTDPIFVLTIQQPASGYSKGVPVYPGSTLSYCPCGDGVCEWTGEIFVGSPVAEPIEVTEISN